jgi:hypothetical protein
LRHCDGIGGPDHHTPDEAIGAGIGVSIFQTDGALPVPGFIGVILKQIDPRSTRTSVAPAIARYNFQLILTQRNPVSFAPGKPGSHRSLAFIPIPLGSAALVDKVVQRRS